MTTLLIAAPILLSLTLLLPPPGLAEAGAREGAVDAMTSLRLPLRPFHQSVATVLPIAEVVLALALWVPFAPLQALVAATIAALMLTYLGDHCPGADLGCGGGVFVLRHARLADRLPHDPRAKHPAVSAEPSRRRGGRLRADGASAGASAARPRRDRSGTGDRDPAGRVHDRWGRTGDHRPPPAPGSADAGRDGREDFTEAEPTEDEELLDYERATIPAGVLQQTRRLLDHAPASLQAGRPRCCYSSARGAGRASGCGPGAAVDRGTFPPYPAGEGDPLSTPRSAARAHHRPGGRARSA